MSQTSCSVLQARQVPASFVHVKEAEYSRCYLPAGSAISVLSIEAVLASGQDLIGRIRQAIGMDQGRYDHVMAPLIRQYAENVHLLPSLSRTGFLGAGGLFRLGLEVGLFSMQAVDGVIWEKGPGARFFEPRRRYAAFVTGLCLHFYQALTGMHVYDEAGETWPAFQESLWQWVKQRRQYQVQPVQEAMPEAGRHLCTILVLNRIMPRAGLQFLLEGSSQLLADLLLALQAEGHDSLGKFGKMIHAMDEKVREREANGVASLPFFMQEESAVERVDPIVPSEQSNPGSAIFTNTGQEGKMDKNTFPAARCSRVGVILPSDVQEKGPGTDSSGSGRILAGEKKALSGQARTVLEGMVKSWKDGTNPDVRLQPQGLAISLAGLMSQDRRGADIRDELWNLGWLYQDSPDCLSRTYPVQIGARQVQCVIVLADIARKLGWLSSDSG